ncbi:hypothetical protein JW916_03635 [Candidatus Sumerlaeota bacterium]|nr:hypothetical protein [Candidatus Sumerlaeota bacterium]
MRDLLRAAGLTPESATMDDVFFDALGSDKFLLRCFPVYRCRPLAIPYTLGHVRLGAIDEPGSLNMTMNGMLTKVDSRVRRGLPGAEPLADAEKAIEESAAPLADAIRALCEARGAPLSKDEAARLSATAANVPRDVQECAALLVHASISAMRWHERAFRFSRGLLSASFQKELLAVFVEEDASFPDETERVVEETDFLSLCAGAEDLAFAVDKVRPILVDRETTETFAFDWPTPLGRVILRAGNDAPVETEEEAILLCIDLDGDDVYRSGGANQSFEQPISILIDAAGNDRYEGAREGRAQFGAGTFGYGILVDCAGDDSYKAGTLALGSGLLGFGALLDAAGDDSCDAFSHAQGAGTFGLGLAIDMKGRDAYAAYTMAQGFGLTKGCGYLLDLGDEGDTYLLRNDSIRFPSAQAPETHNSSLGQGFGLGRRADMTDGHSWAGGYGLLMDEGGDDTYDAAVMAQGSGYWYGLGFLLDRSGDDTYRAHWYCQGTGCHLGIGALIDRSGNDRYVCTAQMSQGAGHDWGTGWLVDGGGDDVYETGDLSLGAASENSLGFFLDLAGDDRYTVERNGNAYSGGAGRLLSWGTLRENQIDLGLFLDCAGKDTYAGIGGAGNNRFWRKAPTQTGLGLRSELGVGLDTRYSGPPPIRLDPYTEAPPDED